MSNSDDSDCEGLKRVSSKKKSEPTYEKVPATKKFKIEVVTEGGSEKFAYKLRADTPLPYKTNLEGNFLEHF